jgi:hypothetical protein
LPYVVLLSIKSAVFAPSVHAGFSDVTVAWSAERDRNVVWTVVWYDAPGSSRFTVQGFSSAVAEPDTIATREKSIGRSSESSNESLSASASENVEPENPGPITFSRKLLSQRLTSFSALSIAARWIPPVGVSRTSSTT